MRIMLLKSELIGKTTHAQGDDVECDDQRGRYLIRHGSALEIKVTRPAAPDPGPESPDPNEPESPEKREAVKKPKTRKAKLDV